MKPSAAVFRPLSATEAFGRNSLNLIRLLSALQVFFFHAVTHLRLTSPPLLPHILSLFAGVPVFFCISGFLMWRSVERTPTFGEYARKRVLRLYPELWGGVALSLLSILILYDGYKWQELLLFGVTQSTFLPFWTPDSLRGFGCGTPNGSLWTVGVLLQFYLAVWIFKRITLRVFGNRRPPLACWLIVLGLSVALNVVTPYLQGVLPTLVYKLFLQTLFPYLWLFWLGMMASAYFDRVLPVLKSLWWLFGLLCLACQFSRLDIGGVYPLFSTLGAVGSCLGVAYAFPRLQIKHDLSYGIYIYHMVVVNAAIALGLAGSWPVFGLVLLITLGLAALSYLTLARLGKTRRNTLASPS